MRHFVHSLSFVACAGLVTVVACSSADDPGSIDELRRRHCGDRICQSYESCSSCPGDCGYCAPQADMAQPVDMAMSPPDLAMSPPDLAHAPPDMAQPPRDMSQPIDMSVPGPTGRIIYLAPSGGCRHHANIGTGCSTDASCGRSAASPCCTFAAASASANLDGDTIEVHEGPAADPSYHDAPDPNADPYCSYSACAANSAIAKLDTAGVTLKAASGDAPVLDLGTRSYNGLLITANRITVDGLTITGGIGSTDNRVAHIKTGQHQNGSVYDITDTRIRNSVFEVVTDSHPDSTSANMCVVVIADKRFILENNECRGGWDYTFLIIDISENGEGIIRNNRQYGNGRNGVGSQRGFMLEHLGQPNQSPRGKIAIYNNTLDQSYTSGVTMGGYHREVHWSVYQFNNIYRGSWVSDAAYGVFFQDNVGDGNCKGFHVEDWYIFNNTFVNTTTGAGFGVLWPDRVQAHVNNNIFQGFKAAADVGHTSASENPGYALPVCTYADRDDQQRSPDNSSLAYDLTFPSSSYAVPTTDTSINLTGAQAGVDPKLDSSGFISSATSGAIGRGSNNPVGQGANMCSLVIFGETIDCTRDIQGQSRTASGGWDIGADEY
jgi:hypothetical protein